MCDGDGGFYARETRVESVNFNPFNQLCLVCDCDRKDCICDSFSAPKPNECNNCGEWCHESAVKGCCDECLESLNEWRELDDYFGGYCG